eukprot:1193999-Prorocentrum_minimum.AAC.2
MDTLSYTLFVLAKQTHGAQQVVQSPPADSSTPSFLVLLSSEGRQRPCFFSTLPPCPHQQAHAYWSPPEGRFSHPSSHLPTRPPCLANMPRSCLPSSSIPTTRTTPDDCWTAAAAAGPSDRACADGSAAPSTVAAAPPLAPAPPRRSS